MHSFTEKRKTRTGKTIGLNRLGPAIVPSHPGRYLVWFAGHRSFPCQLVLFQFLFINYSFSYSYTSSELSIAVTAVILYFFQLLLASLNYCAIFQ